MDRRSKAESSSQEIAVKTLLSVLALGLLATPASAVIVQIDFSAPTTGDPDIATGSIVIDNPFDEDVFDSTAGVTVNGLNFDVESPVGFTFRASDGFLVIGAGDTGITNEGNDFSLSFGLRNTESAKHFTLTQAGQGFIVEHPDGPSNASVTVTELNPIPLPAGLPLLLGGIGILGLIARRRA
jgi:hypothetical protein